MCVMSVGLKLATEPVPHVSRANPRSNSVFGRKMCLPSLGTYQANGMLVKLCLDKMKFETRILDSSS